MMRLLHWVNSSEDAALSFKDCHIWMKQFLSAFLGSYLSLI